MAELSTKRERERLPVRETPYYQRLARGAYLGYRRGPGTWLARYRDSNGKQHHKPLGEALDFDEAKRRAEVWIASLNGSAVRTVKRESVRAALEAYLADLRRHGRADAARDAEWRFKTTVYRDPKKSDRPDDPIAGIELEVATKDDFLEWRDRLLPNREPRTVNRHVRAVVAALNRAVELGHVGNPAAWRLKPLADDMEDSGETAVFLTPEQRAAIINVASTHCGTFLRGLELTGARPSELAAALVGDFDGATLRLAHRKGRPPKLRVRYVVLGVEGVAFFKEHTAGRLPAAPLFTEDGRQPWRRHMWSRAIRAAISTVNGEARGKARIPEGASAYSFRHARISELLQVHGVDPLTVAHQTGTSLVMIEKAYLRFIPAALREKLAAVKE